MYFFSTISHSPSTFPFLWFLICTSVKGFAIAGSLTVNHGSQQLCLHVACIREAAWPSVAAACLSLAVAIGEGVWGNWKYSQTFSPERKSLWVAYCVFIAVLKSFSSWTHCYTVLSLHPAWGSSGGARCWEAHRSVAGGCTERVTVALPSWLLLPRQRNPKSVVVGCTGFFSGGGSRQGGGWGSACLKEDGMDWSADAFCWGSSFWPSPLPLPNVAALIYWRVRRGWAVAEETFWGCGVQLFLAGQPKKSTATVIR